MEIGASNEGMTHTNSQEIDENRQIILVYAD